MNTLPAPLRIAVVVPSFNSGRYIREALESALTQQPAPHEVIVQDGGSTDETLDVLRGFSDAVSWRTEPDGGQSEALNRAISRATGDVVVWLNADDTIVPGAFAAAIDAFRRHPDADFVYGNFDVMQDNGVIIRRHRSSRYDSHRVFTHGCYIFSGAIFYRRELLERVGQFDERLQACMDLDYLMRIGPAYGAHLGRTVARFRISGTSKSSRMRFRFLRESHTIRWRASAHSVRLRMLTLFVDAFVALSLWTQTIRLTRAWSAVRRGKLL